MSGWGSQLLLSALDRQGVYRFPRILIVSMEEEEAD